MGVREWYENIEELLEEYMNAQGTGSHLRDSDPDIDRYLRVETENARYLQFTGIPSKGYITSSVEDEVIDDVDAIVLQNTTPYEELDVDDLLEERYHPIVEKNLAQDDPDPIYVADLPADSLMGDIIESGLERLDSFGKYGQKAARIARKNPQYLSSLPAGRTVSRTVSRNGKHLRHLPHIGRIGIVNHPLVRTGLLPITALRLSGLLGIAPRTVGRGGELASRGQLVKSCTSPGIRSAAAAEKIETEIAPHLEEELGYKPTILLETDIENLDTVRYLENPERHLPQLYESFGQTSDRSITYKTFKDSHLRESVLEFNQSGRMQKLHFTVDHTYMPQICEFRFGDGDQSVKIDGQDEPIQYEKLVYETESELLNANAWPTDERNVLEQRPEPASDQTTESLPKQDD